MQVDLRATLALLRDGVAVRGTEGSAQLRRTVQYAEEFDTLIAVSEIDVATSAPLPVPLASGAPINQGDVLLLMPEDNLTFYFENIRVAADPDPFEAPGGAIEVGAGGLFFIVGGNLGVNPAIAGVVLVQNTTANPVRLRGILGGTVV